MKINRLSNPNVNLWITANAGSGKTTCLVDGFLLVLKSGIQPNEIVCITYTEAGAIEMKNRILARSSKENINISGNSINVSTIHSWCKTFLTINGFIKDDIKILNNNAYQIEKIINIIVNKLDEFDNNEIKQYIGNLARYVSIKQFYGIVQNIIENQNFFLLLFSKICNNQQSISLEDFLSNIDLKDIKLLLPKDLQKFVGYDIVLQQQKNALQNQLSNINLNEIVVFLQDNKIEFNPNENLNILDEWEDIVLTKTKSPRKKIQKCNISLLKQIQEYFIDRLRQNGVNATYSVLYFAYFVLKEYQNIKHEMNVISYDDLLFQTYQILHAPEEIMQNIKYKLFDIKYIMLDEAQDTNPISWKIIQSIVEKTKCKFFVVGDKKQSIYRFQGARVEDYEDNKKKFQALSKLHQVDFVDDINLNISYRSTQNILDYVDSLCNNEENKNCFNTENHAEIRHYSGIETNNKPEGFFLDNKNSVIFEEISSGKDDVVNKINTVSDKSLEWLNRTKDLIVKQENKKKIVSNIADIIAKYINLHKEECNKGMISNNDGIAIIYSKTTTKANAVFDIIGVLIHKYHFNITLKPEIIKKSIYYHDIVAILNFFVLQNDDLNLACLLKSDLFHLTDDILYKICCCSNNSDETLWNKLKAQFITDNNERELIEKSKNFLEEILKCTTLTELLQYIAKYTSTNAKYKKVINLIQQVFDKYENIYDYDVRGFLRILEEDNFKDVNLKNDSDDYIYFSTIHGVKGKEFDTVIILNLEENSKSGNSKNSFYFFKDYFWYKASSCKIQEDDQTAQQLNSDLKLTIEQDEREEKRLTYVSITRAKRRLVFIQK